MLSLPLPSVCLLIHLLFGFGSIGIFSSNVLDVVQSVSVYVLSFSHVNFVSVCVSHFKVLNCTYAVLTLVCHCHILLCRQLRVLNFDAVNALNR